MSSDRIWRARINAALAVYNRRYKVAKAESDDEALSLAQIDALEHLLHWPDWALEKLGVEVSE